MLTKIITPPPSIEQLFMEWVRTGISVGSDRLYPSAIDIYRRIFFAGFNAAYNAISNIGNGATLCVPQYEKEMDDFSEKINNLCTSKEQQCDQPTIIQSESTQV